MADIIYNRFKANLLNKLVDLGDGGDVIKVQLHTNAYTPDKDHNVKADLAGECPATGNYVTGGATLAGQAVSQDDVEDEGVFDGDDVTWANSTITARYAVLIDDTLATDDLICCFDFESDKSSDNGDFKIQWNAEGIINLT